MTDRESDGYIVPTKPGIQPGRPKPGNAGVGKVARVSRGSDRALPVHRDGPCHSLNKKGFDTSTMIPEFRDDGYLPEGVHVASEADVTFRFGTDTSKRRRLALRLRRWIELSRAISAKRLFVDGSFVTSKPEPNDVDAVVWLPDNFIELVS